ncbi:MAG: hypothetical protein NT172_13975 [Planctomycetota bacterium]|nr:hypothetical protein [Planctomycetota bacterium]
MSEFTFDGYRQDVRKILDDSFRKGEPQYSDAELGQYIVPIHFNRDMTENLVIFRKLIDAVMKKQEFCKERSKSDGWLAPRIHNALRLTRREAACKEFWIGLILQNLDYVWWRFEVSKENLLGLRRIDGSEYRQIFSQLWWAVENLRNGSSLINIDKSTGISSLGQFIQHLNMIHSNVLASTLNTYLYDGLKTEMDILEILKKLNYILPCFVRDDIAPSRAPDARLLREWIREKPQLDPLLSDELPQGPPDSPIPRDELDRMLQFVEFVAGQGLKDPLKANPPIH